MANELVYGAGSAAALFDASRVEDMFIETIGDKDYSILAHPAVMYLGDMSGGMTSVSTIPIVDLSDDEFASLTEIQAMTPSDITSATASCTVARRGLERDLGDFAAALDGTGALDEMALADALILAANLTALTLLCTLIATFTTIKGASGAAMTHATIKSGKQALRVAGVKGPYVCILSPEQFNEWEDDFESLGGSVEFKRGEQYAEMARLTGSSYMGSWDNIDFYISQRVTDDGTDYFGAMWGMGAVAWKSLTVRPALGQDLIVDAGFVKVEVQRTGKQALSAMIGNMYLGFVRLQDLGGVKLRSKI